MYLPLLVRCSAADVEEVELEGVLAASSSSSCGGLRAADELGQQVEFLLGEVARRGLVVDGVRGARRVRRGGRGTDAELSVDAGRRHFAVRVPADHAFQSF